MQVIFVVGLQSNRTGLAADYNVTQPGQSSTHCDELLISTHTCGGTAGILGSFNQAGLHYERTTANNEKERLY